MPSRSIRFVFTLLVLFACGIAKAQYPTPAQAGFSKCALIYDRANRGQDDLAPYVARQGGKAKSEWLFDAFLFLIQRSDRNIRTEYGETQKPDWEYQLNRWFAPGRDIGALDQAVQKAASRLGVPASPRRVILAIPFLNENVRDFGDVDGDGRTEDLSTLRGRDAVIKWYIGEAEQRFRATGYKHLTLWGFYWMREDILPAHVPMVQATAEQVHSSGYRFLWIPYHRALGWQGWKKCGFDVAILQPNYAFSTWHRGGNVYRNRLASNADLARQFGLGVEMECFDIFNEESDRYTFRHYMADGVKTRFGYQNAATAFYLGTDAVERTSTSTDPKVRSIYDSLADYVAGRPVPDPDPPVVVSKPVKDKTGTVTYKVTLKRPGLVGAVNINLDEPGPAFWKGTITVNVRPPGLKGWTSGGWALRSSPDPATGRRQHVLVRVGRTAAELSVSFRPLSGSPALKAVNLSVDPNHPGGPLPKTASSLTGVPYTFQPSAPGAYPDTGKLLTDDNVPSTGFGPGLTVGWRAVNTVCVTFDLGKTRPVTGIEAHCVGGSQAAVNFPAQAAVLLSATTQPPMTMSGYGALPAGFTWLSAGNPVIDLKRSPVSMNGRYHFKPGKAVNARYVTLVFQPNGWLMLSEIRIFSGGINIAPTASYSFRPLPSPGDDNPDRYADNGIRLTDGAIANDFSPDMLTGWKGAEPRVVVLDLGTVKSIKSVTVWALRGGLHGICQPASVGLELSEDGRFWTPTVPLKGPTGEEDGTTCVPAPLRADLDKGSKGRYVRVVASTSGEWAMLSEIAVAAGTP
jgi:hypothetical protein